MLVNCVAYHRGQKLSDVPLGEVRCCSTPMATRRFKKAKWM